MNIFWQENIQEASKQWVIYTASGYCLTTAFVRVHADIPTEMARPRRETLGSNILNLGQAWKGRIPWDSKKVHGKGRPPTWNTNVNKHLYSDRNTSKHYKCCYHHAIDSGNIRNHLSWGVHLFRSADRNKCTPQERWFRIFPESMAWW